MEYILELILELALEGSISVSKNKRIPKYIRYPFLVMLSLFFMMVIGLIIFVGVCSLKESIPLGVTFLIIGIWMWVACTIKFRKLYATKKSKTNSK